MSKQNVVVNPLNQCWDLERNQLNLKNPMYRDAIKSYVSSIEFPIHLRDIVNLGLVGGTPTTKNGDYYMLHPTTHQFRSLSEFPTGPTRTALIPLPTFLEYCQYIPMLVKSKVTVISTNNKVFINPRCDYTKFVLEEMVTYLEKLSYLGDDWVPLFEQIEDNLFWIGYYPTHPQGNEMLRGIYHDTYMNLLMLSVRSKRANSETILIRKSAREQFEDTELKIPQSYFHLPSKAFHFIDEVNNISYIVSVKRGELQIVKILPPLNNQYHNPQTGFNISKDIKINLLDEMVININLEDITDNEGYITTKSIKKGFNNYFTNNKYEQIIGCEDPTANGGELFLNILDRFGAENIIGNSPHIQVLSQLLTGVRLNSGMEEQLSKITSPLLEDFCKDTEFIIKLVGFMQDPRQKEIIKRDTNLYRKEYKRGTKMGDEIKYKVWGQNVSLIKSISNKTGAKNRSHYVNGHIRKQPIKDISKYEGRGYVVNNPHGSPVVDMFIEAHWRGDKELGEITTILMFGKQAAGWSRKAISWLDSIASKEKIEIQHALNGGEVAFPLGKGKLARVDGYCKSTNTVYEYYGDYYHGNPKKYGADEYNKICKRTHGELYDKTMKREQMIKALGVNFICIWESDWNNS